MSVEDSKSIPRNSARMSAAESVDWAISGDTVDEGDASSIIMRWKEHHQKLEFASSSNLFTYALVLLISKSSFGETPVVET